MLAAGSADGSRSTDTCAVAAPVPEAAERNPSTSQACRRRLGRFEDAYSPEHLDRSPTQCNFSLSGTRDNGLSVIVTPARVFSPIDRCRTSRANRTRAINELQNSFEGNQSFPRVKHKVRPLRMELDTPPKVKSSTDLVRVDGPNGLRFNSSLASVAAPGEPASVSGSSQTDRLQQGINPNKAVFTIEPNTSKILIVNSKACSLLGYSSAELCSMKLSELMRDKRSKQLGLHEPTDGDSSNEEGTIVVLSGKVVELLSRDGVPIIVSLWIRQLENDGPCLVVAEPVNSKRVLLTVDSESGLVMSCDSEDAAALFQAESVDKLCGLPVTSLIPSIVLPAGDRSRVPKPIAKQKATGRSLDGASFPLCLWIAKQMDYGDSSLRAGNIKVHRDKPVLEITIRVTYNVSGLLVVDESGVITACNHHFSMLTFGKRHSDVIGRPIQQIIQDFCRPTDIIKLPSRNRNLTLSPVNNDNGNSGSDTDEDSCGAFNGSQKSACISLNVQPSQGSQLTREKSSSALCLDKSTSLITHTPTPTQDMVSSISITEQRNDTSALPDITSGMSGISIDEEQFCHASLSKSHSENILRSEQNAIKLPIKENEIDSVYYTSQHSQEVTPTSNAPRVRLNDPSLRLSLDSSKYRQKGKEDRSSLSLDFCDSNETSADFLTPINEMPVSGCEIEELPRNTHESVDSLSIDVETRPESSPRRNLEDGVLDTPYLAKRMLRPHLATSTPQLVKSGAKLDPTAAGHRSCDTGKCPVNCQHKDGTYRGVVLHRDGTQLSVVYTVSGMQLATGARVQCVWLGVRVSDDQLRHTTLASSINSTADNSLAFGNKSAGSRPQSMSLMSQCGEEQVAGDYNRHYVTLKQIGKGAYGCVKMAYRRSDRLLVIAKFILKEKVSAQFWVDSPDQSKKMPLEVSLLLTLQHPNIVTVLDVFENEKYFQMVMEKHGAGMDLFEFIERRPHLDEPLISCIFKQIGQAVEYLHSLMILHRDIKDENVIIDNKFQVKLIDFGSATFMNKETLFSTFYGTTEYCSPEVLAGNKYAGPELEMWSMGITLYVLVFFVNPFSDIEDTIQGPLVLPQTVSEELEHLLRWMLCKDPLSRCSVAQLMAHPWIRQPVNMAAYNFADIVDCDPMEANPEVHYSGSWCSPRSASPPSLADPALKERWHRSEATTRADSKNASKEERKRGSLAPHALSAADKDAQSDNYSLRSSADILDISSKPMSDAALTDISSDATGHAACDIDYDCDPYDCDSWDECEQDSFS